MVTQFLLWTSHLGHTTPFKPVRQLLLNKTEELNWTWNFNSPASVNFKRRGPHKSLTSSQRSEVLSEGDMEARLALGMRIGKP